MTAENQLKRIAKLERALRFYANKANWRDDDWSIRAVISGAEYVDAGKKARLALGKYAAGKLWKQEQS